MESTPTLLQELIHIDWWFTHSLTGWGMGSLVLSVAVIVLFAAATITSNATKVVTWTILAWAVVLLNIITRADHQLHSIGGGLDTTRLLNAAYVLRLMLDALILPGLATAVLLIKWQRRLVAATGGWQIVVLTVLVFMLSITGYVLVRLSDWLMGSP